MNIATVTLSPAIDQTVRADHFQNGQVNRAQAMHFDAGGKGINVASVLADYGLPVVATGFLGDANAYIFETLFGIKGIGDRFVRLAGYTRTNVKIVDEARQETTDINMSSLAITERAIADLLAIIDELTETCDWFVLSGNLPPRAPVNIYATIIRRVQARGKRVVLDTSYEALQQGILAGPTIVKPNLDEFTQILGRDLADETAVLTAARSLLTHGIEMVVVSMREKGALFVTATGAVTAVPPQVNVKSSVGAGDAMVAGLIAAQRQNLALPELARLATAFSVATITRVGAHLPDKTAVAAYASQVTIHTNA
ncbi:MAG: 1-phosphofructokinase [Ardenticatenaceae bacterium]|nr:1-phosphofructokinase [Ardenticatenaceae bacterium]